MNYIQLGFWYDEWHEIINAGESNCTAIDYVFYFSKFSNGFVFTPLVF